MPLKLRRSRFDITAYYYALPEWIRFEPCNDSHPFQAQQVECNGVDAVQPEPSPDDQFQQENIPEPSVCESSALEPGTKPVYYPWGTVSSLLMTSKGEEISIKSKTTGIGFGPGAWSGLSMSTWTGQRTSRNSFSVTLRPSCVSPRKHITESMSRRALMSLPSNLMKHTGPYGSCGSDRSVE